MLRQSFILLMMFFLFFGCNDESNVAPSGSQQKQSESTIAESKSPSSSPEPAPVDYDADPIVMTPIQWKEHEKKLKYETEHLKGRTIRMTGEVSNIGFNLAYYDEKNPTTALWFRLPKDEDRFNEVACDFSGPPVWKSVGPGQKVTLEFKHSGEFTARPTDCKIVSVEGDPFPVIDARELAAAFVKDKAALDKKYISKPAATDSESAITEFESNGERKLLGLVGKVKEVKQYDSGSVTIYFETDENENVDVTAEMFSPIGKQAELPAVGDNYRVWGRYQSEAPLGIITNAVGIDDATPFPVK